MAKEAGASGGRGPLRVKARPAAATRPSIPRPSATKAPRARAARRGRAQARPWALNGPGSREARFRQAGPEVPVGISPAQGLPQCVQLRGLGRVAPFVGRPPAPAEALSQGARSAGTLQGQPVALRQIPLLGRQDGQEGPIPEWGGRCLFWLGRHGGMQEALGGLAELLDPGLEAWTLRLRARASPCGHGPPGAHQRKQQQKRDERICPAAIRVPGPGAGFIHTPG